MTAFERRFLAGCFFVSGATSLVLEVAWSKELSYVLGSTLHAVATVTSAFMAGLCLGSLVASRLRARWRESIRAYGAIQVAIGMYGMISIPLFVAADQAFGALRHSLGNGDALLGLRFVVVFAMVALPTGLMGMTLPILAGAHARDEARFEIDSGRLYGLNTLGAVVGTVVAGFVVVPWVGLSRTCIVAGALDALVGCSALWLHRKRSDRAPSMPSSHGPREQMRRQPEASDILWNGWTSRQWAIGLAFVGSGIVAMACEVTWFRLLALTMGPSIYAFSAMLAVFLAGIGLGSALCSKLMRSGVLELSDCRAFALLQGLIGVLAFIIAAYVNDLPRFYFDLFSLSRRVLSDSGFVAAHLGISALVVFVPSFTMGALFPIVVRVLRTSGEPSVAGVHVGRVYALNTGGGILGSLLAGFVLIPTMGTLDSVAACAMGSLAISACLWLVAPVSTSTRLGGLSGIALVALVGGIFVPRWDVGLFSMGVYRNASAETPYDFSSEPAVLYFKEGLHAPVAVTSQDGVASLRIAGKADASTGFLDLSTEALLGHLPVMLSTRPARVAVIGYGSGVSAGAVLAHPEVKTLDILELEEAVVGASTFFENVNRKPLSDRRTRLIIDDARMRLKYSDDRYDVITSEPSNPWMAGMSNLFTVEFFRSVRDKLSSRGIFCQWVQTYEISTDSVRVVLASLREVFPFVVAFRAAGVGDFMVLASESPIRMPWTEFQSRSEAAGVRQSLSRLGIDDALELAAYFRAGGGTLRALTADTVWQNTDDNVWLEYRAATDLLRSRDASFADLRLSLSSAGTLLADLEKLLPGIPLAGLVRALTRHLYSAELGVSERGDVVDPAQGDRTVVIEGMRQELEARGDHHLLEQLDRWQGQAEDGWNHRVRATQILANPLPSSPRDRLQMGASALELAPDLPAANVLVGSTLVAGGLDSEAEVFLRQAIEHPENPNYYYALLNQGRIAARRARSGTSSGEWDAALRAYEKAIEFQPHLADAFVELFELYQLRGEIGPATEVLEKGLRFHPGDPRLEAKRRELARASAVNPNQGNPGGIS